MNDLIQIITFTHPHEAHLAKSVLEAANIPVIIHDELIANIYPYAVGGVKLLVEGRQVEEALSILKDLGYIKE